MIDFLALLVFLVILVLIVLPGGNGAQIKHRPTGPRPPPPPAPPPIRKEYRETLQQNRFHDREYIYCEPQQRRKFQDQESAES